jgi:hypothetical protein
MIHLLHAKLRTRGAARLRFSAFRVTSPRSLTVCEIFFSHRLDSCHPWQRHYDRREATSGRDRDHFNPLLILVSESWNWRRAELVC